MTREPARLLVTGSRAWDDHDLLGKVLDVMEGELADAGYSHLIVVHGDCRPPINRDTGKYPSVSADWLASLWVRLRPHFITVTEEPHPARWKRPCDPGGYPPCPREDHRRRPKGNPNGTSYCPIAGHRRNAEMVSSMDAGNPGHRAAVFHYDRSTGTQDCIERLAAAGFVQDVNMQMVVKHRVRPSRARR